MDAAMQAEMDAFMRMVMQFTLAAGILGLFMLLCWVKIFKKAGQPGWAAIIPIYNIYIMLVIAKRPGWWMIFYVVPCIWFASPIVFIIMTLDIAKNFGKGALFGLGMVFLPVIFDPILAFGKAEYKPVERP